MVPLPTLGTMVNKVKDSSGAFVKTEFVGAPSGQKVVDDDDDTVLWQGTVGYSYYYKTPDPITGLCDDEVGCEVPEEGSGEPIGADMSTSDGASDSAEPSDGTSAPLPDGDGELVSRVNLSIGKPPRLHLLYHRSTSRQSLPT